MKYAETVLDLVGDTPLVKLNKVTEGITATVLVKVEYLNPGGSSKDRIATRIVDAADAIIRVSAACVCGSDLWPYRGIGVEDVTWPAPMGHEYVGIVEEVGAEVQTVEPGQFVVGSFWASDNTCEICRAGYQSACINRVPMGVLGAQAEFLRDLDVL